MRYNGNRYMNKVFVVVVVREDCEEFNTANGHLIWL